jgi:hypothetical protein
MNEVMISTILCNILVGCFCVLVLTWIAVAVETISMTAKRKSAVWNMNSAKRIRQLVISNITKNA